MQAGELDQRLKLQSKVVVRDDLNGQVVTWRDEATVAAGVKVTAAKFIHLADQNHEPYLLTARIRKGPPVTNLWRGIWLGANGLADRILNIHSVLPTDERDGWDLVCSEEISA